MKVNSFLDLDEGNLGKVSFVPCLIYVGCVAVERLSFEENCR